MILYIAKNIERYNTYLKNLVETYKMEGVKVIVGYETFIYGNMIPDIIHFHWVEGLLKNMNSDQESFFRKLDFFRDHGVKFIYTVHNTMPHRESKTIDYFSFFPRFFQYINLFVHHGSLSIDICKERFSLSDKEHIICHHGDYMQDVKDFTESKITAREILRLPKNKKIILVFGLLQFKNVDFAKTVFHKVKRNFKDSFLMLAGTNPQFKYGDINKLYEKINNSLLNKFRRRKRAIHKRFSQYETFLLFKSSDVIFLPHNSGLTTGIIPMAATIGKPFVYPDIGVFEEQAEYCRCKKYKQSNIDDAFNAIAKLLTDSFDSFDNTKWLFNNSWEKHVKLILNKIKT